MARRLHCVNRMRRALFSLSLVLLARHGYADCPTRVEDLPPLGFLASATRIAMESQGIPQQRTAVPALTMQVGASGGMRSDTDETTGTGSLAGMVLAHGHSVTACASGDVVDIREGSLHTTASAQFPLLFTGFSFGGSWDRDVRLPLSASSAYLRAPLSRAAFQLGVSFLDFEMTDEQNNHLRTMIMPFSVEQAWSKQDDGARMLDRHETAIDVSMFRFVGSDAHSDGQMDIFGFKMDWIDDGNTAMATPPPPIAGFIRMSPLAFAMHKEHWSYELDGGWLGIDGPTTLDCKHQRCYRGFYAGALEHAWGALSIEARAERTGLITPDNQTAFEDRGTATVSVDEGATHVATSAFAARMAMWEGDGVVHRAGLRTSLSHQLAHGFAGVLDGELAHADAITPATPRDNEARLLLSLAWQKRAVR